MTKTTAKVLTDYFVMLIAVLLLGCVAMVVYYLFAEVVNYCATTSAKYLDITVRGPDT